MNHFIEELNKAKENFTKVEKRRLDLNNDLIKFLETGYTKTNNTDQLNKFIQKCKSDKEQKILSLISNIDKDLIYLLEVHKRTKPLEDSHVDAKVSKFRAFIKDVNNLDFDKEVNKVFKTLLFSFLSNSIINSYTDGLKIFQDVKCGMDGQLSDAIFRKLYIKDQFLQKINANSLFVLSNFITSNNLSRLLNNEDYVLITNMLIDISESCSIYPGFISFEASKTDIYSSVTLENIRESFYLNQPNFIELNRINNFNLDLREKYAQSIISARTELKGRYKKGLVAPETFDEKTLTGNIIVLDEMGVLYGQGNNSNGILGTENLLPSDTLVKIDEEVKDFVLCKESVVYLKKDGSVWASGFLNFKSTLSLLATRMNLEEPKLTTYIETLEYFNFIHNNAIKQNNILVLACLEYIFNNIKPTLIKKDVEKLILVNEYAHLITNKDELLNIVSDSSLPRETLSPHGFARFMMYHTKPVLESPYHEELLRIRLEKNEMNSNNFKVVDSIDSCEIFYDGNDIGYEIKKDNKELEEDAYEMEFILNSLAYSNYAENPVGIMYFNRDNDLILHFIDGISNKDNPEEYILSNNVIKYYHSENYSNWLTLSKEGDLVKITFSQSLNGNMLVTKKLLQSSVTSFSAYMDFACYLQEDGLRVEYLSKLIGNSDEERFNNHKKYYKQLKEEVILKSRKECCIMVKEQK